MRINKDNNAIQFTNNTRIKFIESSNLPDLEEKVNAWIMSSRLDDIVNIDIIMNQLDSKRQLVASIVYKK